MPAMLRWSRLCVLAGILAVPSVAVAQTPFYQGKQLSLVINYPPGGPTDTEGRLFARNLGRLLAGSPQVVVKNMPGEGGDLAATWMARTAAPDGISLGYFMGTAARAALLSDELAQDIRRLTFIAAASGISVSYARTDIGGGLKKPSDILSKRDFWVGGLAPDSDRDLRLRMQLDLLDVKHQYVSGYANSADARVAFQRGDFQVSMESLPNYRAAIEPGIVASGGAIPLWFDPLDDGDGFSRSPDADGIPALTFTDFLIKTRGELPRSDLFDAWRLVNQAGTQFLRIVVMAPDTPKEAVAAVTQALEKLRDDQEYREDSIKSLKYVLPLAIGDEASGRLAKLLAPAPKVKALIRDYIVHTGPGANRKPVQ